MGVMLLNRLRERRMNAPPHMRNRWIKFALLVVGWCLLGFVLAVEAYLNLRVGMRSVDFFDAAIPQFGRALMWALLVPAILQLREKMPLGCGHWVGGITFHLGMSFVLMA